MTRVLAPWAYCLMSLTPLAAGAQVMPAPTPAFSPMPTADASDGRELAIGCLATAIAYEAGFEPIEGQQAVAEVILNRLRHSAYPKSICGVVFSGSHRRTGCQFSFTCDGSLNRRLPIAVTTGTRSVATAALDGMNPSRVPGATHYHADYVSPYWAPSLIRIAKIGAHIFYRGAGTRDDYARSRAYRSFSEPFTPDLGSAGAATTAPNAPARPSLEKGSGSASTTFAPWGLPTPR